VISTRGFDARFSREPTASRHDRRPFREMTMSTALRCSLPVVVFALAGLLPSPARGDVLPPEPKTHWEKGQAPGATQVVVAGSCISAAVALAGIIVARWPRSRSRALRLALGGAFAVVLAVVVAGTVIVHQRIEADERAWQDYQSQVESRRRNWRPPPKQDFAPPPPQGAVATSEKTTS
jgi:hypothetical protein